MMSFLLLLCLLLIPPTQILALALASFLPNVRTLPRVDEHQIASQWTKMIEVHRRKLDLANVGSIVQHLTDSGSASSPSPTITSESTTIGNTTESTTKTPASTITSTTVSSIQPNNCRFKNYANVAKCCANPPSALVAFQGFEKTCRVTKGALNALNIFSLNKQQSASNSPANSILFQNRQVKKAFGKNACFVNCYLEANGALSAANEIDEVALTDLLTATQTDDTWISTISSAVPECICTAEALNVPDFVAGKLSCSGKAFVVVQCVLLKMIQSCPSTVATTTCTNTYDLFDKCSGNILAAPSRFFQWVKKIKSVDQSLINDNHTKSPCPFCTAEMKKGEKKSRKEKKEKRVLKGKYESNGLKKI